ncbi:leucyl aminopeptidase family protein [Nocardioides taihuensis]|uniref:Probable cytosol aminopeptidase n=1 Tax=Nocardioides taihuensis TaxID=1835606 RepID=A0ABW0BKF4_9ACTN
MTPPAPSLPPQVSPPEFALSALPPHALGGVECVAVPVVADGDAVLLGPGADEIARTHDLDLLAALEATGSSGSAAKPGAVVTVPVVPDDPSAPARAVLLVGVGGHTPDELRQAGAALARATRDRASVATSVPALAETDAAFEAFVVGMMLGSFAFHWRSQPPEHTPVARVVLAGLAEPRGLAPVLDRALAVGGAGWRARMLASVPSNLKTPAWLADQAVVAGEEAGVDVRVSDVADLTRRGFGGLLAVGRAAAAPPRLVEMTYTPRGRGGRSAPRVVLVGKGITFDTGGLSIKPGEAMVNMKRDMTGGAVVIATMAALAAVECPVRVTGLVAAAENAVGGDAMRPGDVVRHYGGRTTEVTNTDAEGRLVLADALAYAVDDLGPAAVVDVATLTGAIKVALGLQTGGFFANHDGLAGRISAAARQAGEPLWRFPLVADYEDKLSSHVADADNGPSGPGAIMGALFLQHFVGSVPWAHLDIASVGDAPQDRHEWTAGPTGFGARALLAWLGSENPLEGVR